MKKQKLAPVTLNRYMKNLKVERNCYYWARVILFSLGVFTGINIVTRLEVWSEELVGGAINRDVVARNVEHLLKTNECRNCDLRGAWLFGFNLKGADLRGAKLGLANLDYANLENADLRKSQLGDYTTRKYQTTLHSSNNAKGEPVILTSYESRPVSLRNANLRSANLSGLTLTDYLIITGANMTNANLENVKISPYIDFTGVSLQGANLKGITIEQPFQLVINLDLCGAVLTKRESYSYFMRGCKN